jgi:aspartyl protease family protein
MVAGLGRNDGPKRHLWRGVRTMLRFAVIGAVCALSAIAAAKSVVTVFGPHPVAALRQAEDVGPRRPLAEPGATGAAASVSKASDGHYWAQADVNGKSVRFLVDTGATEVALTSEDARRLGFDPSTLDYAFQVTTANGPAKAAEVQLERVSVAGARVDNVRALVIDKGLPTSLLGMTYLGRLSRFEATQSALILRP